MSARVNMVCIHPTSSSTLEDIEGGETIDWATAEAMSFASLLLEGNHVRITGNQAVKAIEASVSN